jgi:Zn-dependent protease with chaperone function
MLDVERDGPADVTLSFDSSLSSRHNFRQILSTALGCPLEQWRYSREDGYENTTLYGECHLLLQKTFFTRKGEIDLQPFKDLLKAGEGDVLSVNLLIPRSELLQCDPGPLGAPQIPAKSACLYLFEDASALPRTLHFRFGYDSARTFWKGGALGFLLLIPIGLTFWFRHRALGAPEEAKPAVSFAYRRFLIWTALLGALVWWTAIDLLRAGELIGFLLPSWNDPIFSSIFPWVLLWFPPASVYFLCLALSSPMDALRGTKSTQSQILGRSFWAVARFMLPIPLVCLAVAAMFHSPRLAVLLFAGTFVTAGLAQRRLARAYGLELHGLTSGELRDRAFAIAQAAGAKLNQLYVLPTERIRMANAFAHAANNIFLTDYLVNNLSRREVDAIIGHEVAHLQKKHIRWKLVLAFVAILAFAFTGVFLETWLPPGFPSGPIFYALLLLGIFFQSRRNEFAADAGAVKLTGDAEALITALAKLSRLNTMPMHWGKLDEKLLTHPSTLRRVKRLAGLGGIPEARLPELLARSHAAPADVYTIPPAALPAGKAFSTRFKSRLAVKIGWIFILVTATLPAIVAFAAQSANLTGTALWLAYLSGLVLTLAVNLALANFLPVRGHPELERALRAKCAAERGSPDDGSALFVGLSPDSTPRLYEGNWAWDLGFLSLTPEHLSYWGEEARFGLQRSEIIDVSLGPGPVGWFNNPSVYLSWRDATGRESTFNLRPMRALSMREMAARTHLLARDLQNWHRGLAPRPVSLFVPATTLAATAVTTGAPAFGQVTSLAPRTLVRGHFLVRDFVVNTFIAVGILVLFGLRFPMLDSLAPVSDCTCLNPTGGGALYVLVIVWLARVLLFTPYWRMREKKPASGAATAAPSPVV